MFKYQKQFSGGQKRRVNIGVSIMTTSRIIIFDEPTAGIDPITRNHIWKLITDLRHSGVGIILSSHSMSECEKLCTKIGFLKNGTLEAIGAPQYMKNK